MASRASRRHVQHEPAAEQEAADGAGLLAADALNTELERDTARRSSSVCSPAPQAPHVGDKRPGTDAAEEVVERIEDSVGGYHITDGACDSAFQPCLSMTRDMKVSLALIARPDLHPDLHPICPGAPKRPRGEADAVQRLARRIRTFAEGKFVPSPQPNVLNKLTDALLVTADAVVKSVAAEAPPLSGNSAFRLLAWTVADARGAQTVIDKPLALTVGKRLQVQAQRVRDDATSYCRPIKERASQERQELLDGPMLNRDGEAALEAAMAVSRARELSELQRAKEDEVYTGFLELESLLPEEQRWDEASPAERVAALEGADEPSPAFEAGSAGCPTDFDPRAAAQKHFESIGIYFPWKLSETDWEREDGTVPPDLAKALGDEVTQSFFERMDGLRDGGRDELRSYVGTEWWHMGLPAYVKILFDEKRRAAVWHAEDVALANARATTAEQASR